MGIHPVLVLVLVTLEILQAVLYLEEAISESESLVCGGHYRTGQHVAESGRDLFQLFM